jgi:phosphate transport system substrate-binding protein
MSLLAAAEPSRSFLSVFADHPEAAVSAISLFFAIAGWLINSFGIRRKRVAFRVQDDEPFVITPPPESGGVEVEFRREGKAVPDPSQVLLRIKNAGSLDVEKDDFVEPMTFRFPGREVIGFKFSEAEPRVLEDILSRDEAQSVIEGSAITLPRVPMNRTNRFNLRVLLSGAGDEVRGDAFIRGGTLVRDYKRRFSASTIVFGAITGTLALALVVSLLVGWLLPSPPAGVVCATGPIEVTGSTVFASLAREIGDAYQKGCPRAKVTVDATGSIRGLDELNRAGKADPGVSGTRVTMSDGLAPRSEFSPLRGHPVGVLVFAVVVNRQAGMPSSLTSQQLQAIYRGEVGNWRQVGGPDLPISLVSRGAESGTRGAFETKVLHAAEPGVSSNDCQHRDRDQGARTLRCEVPDTRSVLEKVDAIPGAIGYADARQATKYLNVNRIQLDGADPDIERVKQGQYPFAEVEYLYTYGLPAGDSPAATFLSFLNADTAKNILRSEGYTPCVDRQEDLSATLCGAG